MSFIGTLISGVADGAGQKGNEFIVNERCKKQDGQCYTFFEKRLKGFYCNRCQAHNEDQLEGYIL